MTKPAAAPQRLGLLGRHDLGAQPGELRAEQPVLAGGAADDHPANSRLASELDLVRRRAGDPRSAPAPSACRPRRHRDALPCLRRAGSPPSASPRTADRLVHEASAARASFGVEDVPPVHEHRRPHDRRAASNGNARTSSHSVTITAASAPSRRLDQVVVELDAAEQRTARPRRRDRVPALTTAPSASERAARTRLAASACRSCSA